MGKTSSASSGAPSSKSLLFMMIAMTCGFSVLLGGGLVMASRVIHAMQLRTAGDKSTVRTPLGDFRFEKAKQVGPGLPVYPQSDLVLPGADSSHVSLNDDAAQVLSSTYHTSASREFVVNWYMEHLSPEFTRQDSGPKKLPEVFHNSHITDDDIAFLGERGDQVRVVSLSTDDTGTKITLLRAANQASTPAASESPTPTQ
ncbi:MAG TPA: hypothetical protein VMO76_11695 [Candidatus Udaeobacter sp.]|jgi:hypothetical protein|nr:hypothetical protein [Candidatus Udaeobacter sp.]